MAEIAGRILLPECFPEATGWIDDDDDELRMIVVMMMMIIGKKIEKRFFDFLSPGLGINVSLFRLSRFRKVWARLRSPGSGVEIGTG